MSSYALNKALYEIRKRNGLKADARDYEEEQVGYKRHRRYDVNMLDRIERKLDILLELATQTNFEPVKKELIRPIVLVVTPNSSTDALKSELESYLK